METKSGGTTTSSTVAPKSRRQLMPRQMCVATSLSSDPGHGLLDLLQAERRLVQRGLRYEVLDAGLEAVETRGEI